MFIVAGSIQHESNSLCPTACGYEDFDIATGPDMPAKIAPAAYFRQVGAEIHPTLYANSVPSGAVRRDAFDRLLDEMLALFPKGRRIDGVWLYCHGAMDVEGLGSGDARILSAVRNRVAPDVPIALALDFHANNASSIASDANIVCGYRTAPHTDIPETQMRAARLLIESVRRGKLPRNAYLRVPMVITGDMVITSAEPMRSIIAECGRIEREPGILSASVFNGHPWIDAENSSSSVVVTAEDGESLPLARRHAERLGLMMWDAKDRYRFQVDALPPSEAVRAAIAAVQERSGLVFISDSGDNTTAGALAGGAILLNELVAQGAKDALVAGITGAEAVEACRGLEPGSRVSVRLGYPEDGPCGIARLDAVLRRRSRIMGWDGEDAGDCVLLSVSGIDMIVTARPCAVISPEIIASSGARLADYRIVAVKLGYLYPKFAAVAGKAILALTPGVSREDVENIPYARLRRPIWPLDRHFSWRP